MIENFARNFYVSATKRRGDEVITGVQAGEKAIYSGGFELEIHRHMYHVWPHASRKADGIPN